LQAKKEVVMCSGSKIRRQTCAREKASTFANSGRDLEERKSGASSQRSPLISRATKEKRKEITKKVVRWGGREKHFVLRA